MATTNSAAIEKRLGPVGHCWAAATAAVSERTISGQHVPLDKRQNGRKWTELSGCISEAAESLALDDRAFQTADGATMSSALNDRAFRTACRSEGIITR